MEVLEHLAQRLHTEDPGEHDAALVQASELVNAVAAIAVRALERGPNRFLIAERLPPLGSVLIPHLKRLVHDTEQEDARVLGALVLLQLGSAFGVPVLLNAVRQDRYYAEICATQLAQAGVPGAGEAIVTRLRSSSPDDVELCVSLVLALKQLNVPLPRDIAERFSGQGVPSLLRGVVA